MIGLTQAVTCQSLVALVGASGCGKSSVARAGLIPRLRSQEGSGPVWETLTLLPGDRPLQALAAALLPLLEPEMTEVDRLAEVNKLAAYLQTGDLALRDVMARVLAKQPGTDRLLLVADQWEELYTLTRDEDTRRRFLDEILQVTQATPLSVVLTLRGDFFGQALSYRPLADRLQDAVINLGPMTRAELAQAVERPATEVKLTFEPGLVERLLDDVGQEPGNLPLLEFALTNLWERRQGGQLLHQAYDDMGRVQGALAQKAEELYQRLSPLEQQAAGRVFLELVQTGENAEDTRRRAPLTEVGEETRDLVKKLTDGRLLVTGRDAASGQEIVEVAHEALIQHWSRFQGWLNADREFLLWRQRLRHDLEDWQRTGRDEGALLRGASLAEAEGWLSRRTAHLTPGERQFIQAGLDLRERERQTRQRQQRRWFLALASGLILALVLMTLAGWQWWRAEGERRVSLSRQLAAQSLHLQESRLDLSLLLSVAATRVAETLEAKSSLLAGLLHYPHLIKFLPGLNGSKIVFSCDGHLLASAIGGGTIKVWDMASRQAQAKLFKGNPKIKDLAFSPNGKILASVSPDDSIRLWDIEQSQPLPALFTNSTNMWCLAFSPDGRMLATAGEIEGAIMLWEVETGQLLARLHLPEGVVYKYIRLLAFSPDSRTLVSSGAGDQKSLLVFWDVERQAPGPTLDNYVDAMVFSPDGRTLVFSDRMNLFVCDMATKQVTSLVDEKTLQRISQVVDNYIIALTSLNFSADGKILAAAGNGLLIYFDMVRHKLSQDPLKIISGSPIAIHPNLSTLAISGTDLLLWDVNQGVAISQVCHDLDNRHEKGFPIFLWKAGFSRDGCILALTRAVNPLNKLKPELWDTSRRQFVNPPWPQPGYFIGQEGDVLIVADETGAKNCWDISRKQFLGKLPQEYDAKQMAAFSPKQTAAFSPDGRVFAYVIDDKIIKLWDLLRGQPLGRPLTGPPGEVNCLAFSPDGKTLASADGAGQLQLWNVARQESLGPPLSYQGQHQYSVSKLMFSPDGKILAAKSPSRIVFWDPMNRRLLGPLEEPGPTYDTWKEMAFSPDGQLLAVSAVAGLYERGFIRLWDVAQRRVLQVDIPSLGDQALPLAFSKNCDTLMSVDRIGRIIFHDMRLTSWQALACQRANRNLTRAEWQQYLPGEPYRPTCPDLPVPEE